MALLPYNDYLSRTIDNRLREQQILMAAGTGRLKDIKQHSGYISKSMADEMLLRSCERGQLEIVDWLLHNSAADINYRLIWTPLTVSCALGHVDIVKFLMTVPGIDVNLSDALSRTPMEIAKEYKYWDIVKCLSQTRGCYEINWIRLSAVIRALDCYEINRVRLPAVISY